ncbi:hypothetical protein D3873_07620 [Paenisporosarcina cavernae]|uniref:Uncharacterized protein n=1 Tax=Paenisporosarcina cavernae TaxID=2320858 RepID=A0A385YV28_9BACL|nr:hypothetical protein [Paenisporosarcina cavernae]AYC29767.1 hypothetical protein D3873_07620 [Paenisporosarcina cavernae]
MRRYNPHLLPPWLRKCRFYCKDICVPIFCFQFIRVIFIPTTLDVFLLIILLFLVFAFHHDML